MRFPTNIFKARRGPGKTPAELQSGYNEAFYTANKAAFELYANHRPKKVVKSMKSTSSLIDKLNEMRAYELRQSNLYRMAAQMVTGLYRNAAEEEFHDHAEEEQEHADLAMERIMGLGGDIESYVLSVPVFHNLKELLHGIEKFEEDGIKEWTEVLNMLDENDSFRHVVESILETETEHYNDIKRYLREDFTMKKSLGDFGSIVPLNWNAPEFEQSPVETRQSNAHVQAREAFRAGTPVTIISGAFNGLPSALKPNIETPPGPPLIMAKSCNKDKDLGDKVFDEDTEDLDKNAFVKALLRARKQGSSRRDVVGRKRDDRTGRFSHDERAGKESSGSDDAEQLMRLMRKKEQQMAKKAKIWQKQKGIDKWAFRSKSAVKEEKKDKALRKKKIKKALGVNPLQGQAKQDPNNLYLNSNINNMEPPLGYTPNGAPIFDDPYHQSHSAFGPEDHQVAANMHDQMFNQLSSQGQTVASLGAQQKANIHRMLSDNAMSPSERAYNKIYGQQGMSDGQVSNQIPPSADFNKPTVQYAPQDGSRIGPVPGMTNTLTGQGTGLQTQQDAFAGTQNVPQEDADAYANSGADYAQQPGQDDVGPVVGPEQPSAFGDLPDVENSPNQNEMVEPEQPEQPEMQEQPELPPQEEEQPTEEQPEEDEEDPDKKFEKSMINYLKYIRGV